MEKKTFSAKNKNKKKTTRKTNHFLKVISVFEANSVVFFLFFSSQFTCASYFFSLSHYPYLSVSLLGVPELQIRTDFVCFFCRFGFFLLAWVCSCSCVCVEMGNRQGIERVWFFYCHSNRPFVRLNKVNCDITLHVYTDAGIRLTAYAIESNGFDVIDVNLYNTLCTRGWG